MQVPKGLSISLLGIGSIGLLYASTLFSSAVCQVDQQKMTVTTVERKSDITPFLVLLGLAQGGLAIAQVLGSKRDDAPVTVDVKAVPSSNKVAVSLKPKQPVVAVEPKEEEDDEIPFGEKPLVNLGEASLGDGPPKQAVLDLGLDDEDDPDFDLDEVRQRYTDGDFLKACLTTFQEKVFVGADKVGKSTAVTEAVRSLKANDPSVSVFATYWQESDLGKVCDSAMQLTADSFVDTFADQVEAVYSAFEARARGDVSRSPIWLVNDDFSITQSLLRKEGRKSEIESKLLKIRTLGHLYGIGLVSVCRSFNLKALGAMDAATRSGMHLMIMGQPNSMSLIQEALRSNYLVPDRKKASELSDELDVLELLSADSKNPILLALMGDPRLVVIPKPEPFPEKVTVDETLPPGVVVGPWGKPGKAKKELPTEPTLELFDECQQALNAGTAPSQVIKTVLGFTGSDYQRGVQFYRELIAKFSQQEM